MSSGVKLGEKCFEIFNKVKMNSKGHKRRFVVYKITDDLTEIIEDECIKCEDNHPQFWELIQRLPDKDARYIVYDYPFKAKSGADTSKLIQLMWCPEHTPVKHKMVYAASKEVVKKMINEEVPYFQVDCLDDICEADILSKVNK
ncbi:uncharacterized protein LOC143274987 [Babylonia areolata]|uniref:uncharacterized protein LOC143274987 n=1 Tax=Babylonia areolata TaxID=304850 RepID=UPI003FD599BB